MPDFSRRSEEIEIMDDLNCSGEVVNQTLRELEFINTWLGGNHVTTNGIRKLLQDRAQASSFEIADIGCGGGDMLARLYKRQDVEATDRLVGIDANPHIIAFAKENVKNVSSVEFKVVDVFSDQFREMKFDVVIATLFLHHFTSEQLVEFFSHLKKQVRIGIVINDLHRHPLAYHSIRILTKMFSKSSMVKYDAPLSVLRSFSKKDWSDILKKAGVDNYMLRWYWAFRWQLIIKID